MKKQAQKNISRRIKCQFYDRKKYNNLKFKRMGLTAERQKMEGKEISEIETENSTKCLKKN